MMTAGIRRSSIRSEDPQASARRLSGVRSGFAPDVLCHLQVAAMLERLGFSRRQIDQFVGNEPTCESLLARLRRVGRGGAP